ncbi:hypothetical protein CerSpe_243010 [Prunus speciosa]
MIDSNGAWTTGKPYIHVIVISHFKELFSMTPRIGEMVELPQLFPNLDSEDLNMLNNEVSNVDIKISLSTIGGLKAPGLNNVPVKFFHDHCPYASLISVLWLKSGLHLLACLKILMIL